MNAERLLAHYERIADAPDAIARLRRFILDLAVRGKLVPQDANDEAVSELLKRIAKEKARLLKAGEIRKGKRENADLTKPPFELPDNWTWTAFGDVHQLIRGVTYSKSDVSDVPSVGFVPVLRANNIGTLLTHEEPVYVNERCVAADQFLRFGDFMIALSSGSKNLVGKAAFVPDNYYEAFGGFCGVIRLIDQSLQGLVRVFLQSDFYRESIAEGSRGIGINNLKKETLSNLFFPLPPLAEQRRIVAKVDELMGLCDRLEAARAGREAVRDRLAAASLARLNAPDPETFPVDTRFALDALPALTTRPDQIKCLRQTILNLAVRGRLVPQDANDEPASELLKRIAKEKARLIGEKKLKRLKELPPLDSDSLPFNVGDGWNWVKADDVFLNVTDGFHNTPSPVMEGFPYLTAKHIRPNKIDFENCLYVDPKNHRELFAKTRVKRGDILIVNIGAGCGTAAMVNVDYEFSFKNVAIVNLPSVMDGRFILLFLLYYRDIVFDELIKGGAQPFLGLGMLREMLIPLPPLSEQHRIVAKVDALMALCTRLEASLTATAATRRRLLDALLAEALTPVDDREREAAE